MAKTATATKSAKTEKPVKVTKSAAVQPRLKELYNKELKAKLLKELGLKNINQVPELKKVVVSAGVGKKREDKRFTETVELTLAKITGQKATSRLAKKSIATFKIRKGMGAPLYHTYVISTEFRGLHLIHRAITIWVLKSKLYFLRLRLKMLRCFMV